MSDARYLSRPPTLNDLQVGDEIWNALSVERNSRCPGERPLKLKAADAVQVRAAAAGAVAAIALRGDRGGEAAAERSGVGQQVGLVEALLVGREEVIPARAAAGERIERRRLPTAVMPAHVT